MIISHKWPLEWEGEDHRRKEAGFLLAMSHAECMIIKHVQTGHFDFEMYALLYDQYYHKIECIAWLGLSARLKKVGTGLEIKSFMWPRKTVPSSNYACKAHPLLYTKQNSKCTPI